MVGTRPIVSPARRHSASLDLRLSTSWTISMRLAALAAINYLCALGSILSAGRRVLRKHSSSMVDIGAGCGYPVLDIWDRKLVHGRLHQLRFGVERAPLSSFAPPRQIRDRGDQAARHAACSFACLFARRRRS